MGVALPSLAGSVLPPPHGKPAFAAPRRAAQRSAAAAMPRHPVRERADPATIRAFAGVGLAALFAAPLLLTASFLSGFPLAVPAIIAIGYLGVAEALRSRDGTRAKRFSAVLMAVFLAWTALACLSGETAGAATALLVPAFATAPALVRRALAVREDPRAARARNHAETLDACAPGETVLFVATDGTILAATAAAGALKTDVPVDEGTDLAAALPLAGRAALLNALRHPAGGGSFDLRFGDGETAAAFSVSVRLVEAGIAALRLAPGAEPAAAPAAKRPSEDGRPAEEGETAILDEALSFALRHAGTRAESGPDVECALASGLKVACGRTTLRRILVHLLEAAAPEAGSVEPVRIEARPVRGAVLVRVEAPASASAFGGGKAARALARLSDLVDAAGGTMIAAPAEGARIVTLRLRPASIDRTTDKA